MKSLERFAVVSVPLLLCACVSSGPVTPLPAPVAAADYQRHLQRLASDEFEGRKPGTEGERRTVEYLIAEFGKLGLEPGNGDSWLQQVPIVEMTTGSDASLSLGEQTLRYLDDMVVWTRRVVPEMRLESSPLVFVGHGIVAPEYGWNDYAGLDMRGKTAVILVNEPGFATGDASLFRGRALTYYGRWTYKFEEAARQGAAGALIVHQTEPAGYPWHTVRNGRVGPQVDLASADDNAGRVQIEGWITTEAADALFRAAGTTYAEALQAASQPGFQARLLPMQATAAVRNVIRRSSSANVVARIPGSRRADEYVLYMAHWDHLGRSLARSGDTVFNGAVDNATGVSGLLSLAAAFMREPRRPERTVVFFAPTAEESGLLGSAYYVDQPLYPLARTLAVLNMDAISFGGPTRDVSVVGWGMSDLQDLLAAAARRQERILMPEPTPENGYYYRSDHFNFAKAGVPALYFKLGIDDRERGTEGGIAQRREYELTRYHTVADEYQPGQDLRGGLEDLQLMYAVGSRLAYGREVPAWRPDSEFRAIRERSLEADRARR
ncbi:MAG: M28 family peptidase [Sinobacteraceae bacterium]|nr:M28 family peptidase [Nevskiaceae bacterium]MCP5340457.1 M28 family peptidase [Nevskiaceae bacterium]MCP5359866.1 M28 family peptidase [Nevskiaceae bacterium]MCP5467100.1 M28 family peptidase [Nevskiaceae bacterium]MCP5472640.1 M28 family peptidase [Nevskiaceae bacterium]